MGISLILDWKIYIEKGGKMTMQVVKIVNAGNGKLMAYIPAKIVRVEKIRAGDFVELDIHNTGHHEEPLRKFKKKVPETIPEQDINSEIGKI